MAVVEDVAAAVEEIEWARRAGLRGVILRSQPISGPGWHHPRYEPIWEVCESLAMPIHTHGGESLEYGDLPASRSIFFTEVTWFAHRIFWFLLWSGVLERHADLRVVLAEQFADWMVWDGTSTVPSNFIYTLRIFKSCKYLLKFCHRDP